MCIGAAKNLSSNSTVWMGLGAAFGGATVCTLAVSMMSSYKRPSAETKAGINQYLKFQGCDPITNPWK